LKIIGRFWFFENKDFIMKSKNYSFLVILICCFFNFTAFSQNTFPSSGRVGIGTTSPSSTLDIVETNSGNLTIPLTLKNATNAENTGVGIGLFTDGGYRGGVIYLNRDLTSGPRHSLRFTVSGAPSGGVDALVINDNGNIGIGTTNPQSSLDILRDSGNETIATFRTPEGTINIAAAGASTENPNYGNYISSRNVHMNAYEDLGLKTAVGIPQLLVKTNGSVGIGTAETGNHKLAVEGSIGAREVKVQATGWSDFVFESDYQLPTLEEVNSFIQKNGHLKDIPSAAEVKENGVLLGEMNAKLLQKIEELTLYIIDQNEKIKKQQLEMQHQSSFNRVILNRLKKIEGKI